MIGTPAKTFRRRADDGPLIVVTPQNKNFVEVGPPLTKPSGSAHRSAYTQIRSDSLICTQHVGKDSYFLHADSEDSDHPGQTPRLIRVFAVRTEQLVGFTTNRLNYLSNSTHQNQRLNKYYNIYNKNRIYFRYKKNEIYCRNSA